MRTLDSITLSKYVLALKGPMSHLKLQKLLYYIQAWHLAILGKPIIEDEFEAWLHGPVSRKVWDTYKDASVLYNQLSIGGSERDGVFQEVKKSLSEDQLELLDDVLSQYGDKSAYYLESLTHSEDPWLNARKGLGAEDACEVVIKKEEMKKYFEARLGEGNEQN